MYCRPAAPDRKTFADYNILFDEISWDDVIALESYLSASLDGTNVQAGLGEPRHGSPWMPINPLSIDPNYQHEALVKLSKTNLDLHSNLARIAINKGRIDFCSFIHQASPLNVDNVTVTELGLIAFQDFIGVLADLQKACEIHKETTTPHPSISFRSTLSWNNGDQLVDLEPAMFRSKSTPQSWREPSVEPGPEMMDQPLALVISSCYIQVIALFEEIFHHILMRLETLATNLIEPVEGLKFGAFLIGDGHLQGLIFFQVATSLLILKAGRLLGHPLHNQPSAATDQQIELLSANSLGFFMASSHHAMRIVFNDQQNLGATSNACRQS